jgi:glycosyltransferase involved in cell wall biosynthesis
MSSPNHSRPVKVALYNVTTTTKTGGVESFVWELARHLTARYPELQIDIIGGKSAQDFAPFNPGPKVRVITRPFIRREILRRLPVLSRKFFGFTKLLERLSFGLMTMPLLWQERYDILHIQKPYDLPVAQLLRLTRGSKLLFGCHGKDFFPLDRWFSQGIDGAVSCSHFNAETVQEHYGILPVVVNNGIDADFFAPRPPKSELRAQLAPDGECVLFYVGRLVRWKGAQYLIEALPSLNQKGLRTRAVIAGDGPYRSALEALAIRLNVSEQVLFLGNLPNQTLPDYYAVSDVVVGTSFANETFGIALCEAAACERPIVASAFGGFKEVVQDGKTGLLYRPQDSTDLAEKLETLLRDPELRQKMGQVGRAFVKANFTWDCVAERVYQQYQNLLKS